METVLLKDCGNDENDAQKTLMLHVSKADADPSTVSDFFIRCSKMKIKRDKDDELEKWRTMAYSILKNKHVNEIIDACIKEYGVEIKPSSDFNVEIVYITYTALTLRGFSGVNTVYVNEKHFKLTKMFYEDVIDRDVLDMLMQIDVLNLVVHEYAHVKFRKFTNDFNMSSPIMAKNNKIADSYFEFGRYVEEKIFGAAVDWARSESFISTDYLESVMNSVKNGTVIPRLEDLCGIVIRASPILMALDYTSPRTYE